MTRLRARRGAALLLATVGLLSSTILSPTLSPADADSLARASSVTVSVLSVSPNTPAITSTPRSLVITVSLENTTDRSLSGVSLTAERGDPIGTQSALNASLLDTAARTGGKQIAPTAQQTVNLSPHGSATTSFRTTTSRIDSGQLCLCLPAIVYPIDLSAQADIDGTAEVLGGARTYLPSFDQAPSRKLGVTWIWPLIDRPHRSTDGTVFTDDDLAASIAGGRLDRALQVVERVERAVPTFPITLVVDPELLDELQVMAAGSYTVQSSATRGAAAKAVPGTGQQVAASWLTRLRALLADHENVDIQLTPLADPDITGLSQRGGDWSMALNSTVAAGVTTALNGLPAAQTLDWPPTGALTSDTLDRLASAGVDTVVLDGSRVRPSSSSSIPVSLARLRASTRTVNALLTAPVLQQAVQSALMGSTSVLPKLMSELAVRVAQRPSAQQNVVLAAPRYVDPSVSAASSTILSTATSLFSTPVSAAAAVTSDAMPSTTSALRRTVSTSFGLTAQQLDSAEAITRVVPAVRSLIDGSTAGQQVVNTFSDEVARVESAAWSPAGASDSVGGGPTVGAARAAAMRRQVFGYLGCARILQPNPNSYTLASRTSPLPISVRNDCSLTVSVRLSLHALGGLPGFPPQDVGLTPIAANSKVVVKVPTHVTQGGRIPVEAVLSTPSGRPLGTPVNLFVHSTVLGTIGVVITILAGVVLALALLVRYIRRVLRIRNKRDAAASSKRRPRGSNSEREPVS